MPKKKLRKPNAVYELHPIDIPKDMKRILAFDPGSRNMGVACVAVDAKARVKIISNSIVTNPINDLINFTSSSNLFMDELDRWLKFYVPNGIIAERFQTRGNSGPLIEFCTAMLGIIRGRTREIPFKAITAATWKNSFHRRFNIELDELYKLTKTTSHQLDACMIGIFGLEQGLDTELKYDPFDIVKQAEKTSLIKLLNKRT